ncbi:MAG: aspartate 1-decarboxylase [Alphaproteobacteria bacterium]|nr:MAG: aspartate 1-decarboxylase [Alphaproteobacteria bacterium]
MAKKRLMFKSKIHRATVTEANLDYEGSVTMSSELMAAADIIENEQVHVWNITRGTRLQTYAICGEKNSGVICINGAAAHLMQKGDTVIIATFEEMDESDAVQHKPKVVFVDENNKTTSISNQEIGGPNIRIAS